MTILSVTTVCTLSALKKTKKQLGIVTAGWNRSWSWTLVGGIPEGLRTVDVF